MSVLWGLGQPGPDIGQQFQAGMDHGRAVRQQQDRTNALRGYAANPNDQGAQNALLVADPQLATNLEDQRFQRDHAQHQRAIEALAEHKDRIITGAQFLQGVTDEAGYQRALALARQSGIPIDDVPQHFDPEYVQGIITTAHHLLASGATGPTVLAEGSTLVDPATGQVIASGAARQPRYYPVPPGGRLELDPSYQGPVQGAPAASPHILTDEEMRRMESGGGSPSNGSGGF